MDNLSPVTQPQDVPTKKYVDDGLAGKSNLGHDHDADYPTGKTIGGNTSAEGEIAGNVISLQGEGMDNRNLFLGKMDNELLSWGYEDPIITITTDGPTVTEAAVLGGIRVPIGYFTINGETGAGTVTIQIQRGPNCPAINTRSHAYWTMFLHHRMARSTMGVRMEVQALNNTWKEVYNHPAGTLPEFNSGRLYLSNDFSVGAADGGYPPVGFRWHITLTTAAKYYIHELGVWHESMPFGEGRFGFLATGNKWQGQQKFAGGADMLGSSLSNLPTPSGDSHAATKGYADTQDDAHSTADRAYTDAGLASHAAAADPHPQYMTQAESDALYAPLDHQHSQYLPLAGGTLTGPLTLDDHPTESMQAATKEYVDSISGGAGDHSLLLNLDRDDHGQYAPIHVVEADDPDPTENQRTGQIVVRKGVEVDEGLEFVQKQGGQMTGPLLLQGLPSSANEAATKESVDNAEAAAKEYVDDAIDAVPKFAFGSISDGVISAPKEYSVTFPAGLFSASPRVFAQDHTDQWTAINVKSVSTTGATLTVRNLDNSTSSVIPRVWWMAVGF